MALTLATLEPSPFPLHPSIPKNIEGDKGLLKRADEDWVKTK